MRQNNATLLLCPLSLSAGIATMKLIWDNVNIYDHTYGPPWTAPLWLLGALWLCYCMALGAAAGLSGRARLSPDDQSAVIRLWFIELALSILAAMIFFCFNLPLISFALLMLLCILTGSGISAFVRSGRVPGMLSFFCLCWTAYMAYICLGICLF